MSRGLFHGLVAQEGDDEGVFPGATCRNTSPVVRIGAGGGVSTMVAWAIGVPCWSMTFPDKVTLFCAILPAGSRQINVNSSPVMNLISVPYKRS